MNQIEPFNLILKHLKQQFFGRSPVNLLAFAGTFSEFYWSLIALWSMFTRHFFDKCSVPVEGWPKNSRRNAIKLPFEGREKVEGIPADFGTSSEQN